MVLLALPPAVAASGPCGWGLEAGDGWGEKLTLTLNLKVLAIGCSWTGTVVAGEICWTGHVGRRRVAP